MPDAELVRSMHSTRAVSEGCASCSNRRPGWFCSVGNSVLADLELATSTIQLTPQVPLFIEGNEAHWLYLVCGGYLKLTTWGQNERQMIVRIAGPGSVLGLHAAISHGVYEVSAATLTNSQLRPIERGRFLNLLRTHKEAQMRTVQSICQEYRYALQDACRISLSETVAARVGRLLLEFSHQIGEPSNNGTFHFPQLLTHEEMASMTGTTRESVSRTLSQFRKEGWISIHESLVTIHAPDRLRGLQ